MTNSGSIKPYLQIADEIGNLDDTYALANLIAARMPLSKYDPLNKVGSRKPLSSTQRNKKRKKNKQAKNSRKKNR